MSKQRQKRRKLSFLFLVVVVQCFRVHFFPFTLAFDVLGIDFADIAAVGSEQRLLKLKERAKLFHRVRCLVRAEQPVPPHEKMTIVELEQQMVNVVVFGSADAEKLKE